MPYRPAKKPASKDLYQPGKAPVTVGRMPGRRTAIRRSAESRRGRRPAPMIAGESLATSKPEE